MIFDFPGWSYQRSRGRRRSLVVRLRTAPKTTRRVPVPWSRSRWLS